MKVTFLILVLCILCGCGPTDESPEVVQDPPRMVWAQESLYVDTGRVSEDTPRCGVMDGELTTQVDAIPTKEGESNFGAGCGYQIGSEEDTIEVNIDGEWHIFCDTKRPPEMEILHGDEVFPSMRGGFSWTSMTKNGESQTLIADALHPLECKELAPILTLKPSIYSSLDPNLARLEFTVPPDRITARCWSANAWGNPDAEAETVEVTESSLSLKENCIYEVTAEWDVQNGFGGEVHYVFCAMAPKLCGYPTKE